MSGDGDSGGSSGDRDTEDQRGITSAYTDMAASMSDAGVRGMDGRGAATTRGSTSSRSSSSVNDRVSGAFSAVADVNQTPSDVSPGFSAFDGLDSASERTVNTDRAVNDRIGGAFDAVAEANPGTATARSTDPVNDRIGQTFDVVEQPGITRGYQQAAAGLTNAGVTNLGGTTTFAPDRQQRGLLTTSAGNPNVGRYSATPNKANYELDTLRGSQQYAMDYYMSKGMSRVAAAGMVGNLTQESGMNTRAVNPKDGRDGSNSIGAAQWNGERAKGLETFAASQNRDINDIDTQLDYTMHEFETTERAAHRGLQAAKTVEQATIAAVGFERPSGWSRSNPRGAHGFDNRLGQANVAYDLANSTFGPARQQAQAAATQPNAQPSAAPASSVASTGAVANTNTNPEPEAPTPQRGILGNIAAGVIDVGTGLVPGVGTGAAVVNGGVSLATGRSIGQHVVDGILNGDIQPGNQNPEAEPHRGNGESGDHFLETYLEPEPEEETEEEPPVEEEARPATYDPNELNSLRPTPQELWGRRRTSRALSA